MRNLIWRPDAELSLLDLTEYIAQRNPRAALTLESAIIRQVTMLRQFPAMGRLGRAEGTRELVVHPNYIIIYQVTPDAVTILRLLHARQQYP